MTLEEFRSHLNSFVDVAHSDRFRVTIQPPKSLLGKSDDVTRKLSFQCEQAELPGKTLNFFETRTYGPGQKFPYQSVFSDLNLGFICMSNPDGQSSAGLWEKRFFEDWLEIINPSPNTLKNGQWNLEYKENYRSTITVEHFDVFNNVTETINYLEAFPYLMNPIPLNWGDDSIMKLNVAFHYTRWERPPVVDNGMSQNPDTISTSPSPSQTGNPDLNGFDINNSQPNGANPQVYDAEPINQQSNNIG